MLKAGWTGTLWRLWYNCLQISKMEFGKWLKHRRRELGLSRESLAQRISYSPIAIKKVESSERRPSEAMALALGKFLGISPDKLDAFVIFARGGPCDTGLARYLMPSGTKPVQPTTVAPKPVSAPPMPLTPLIGRQKELQDAIALLKQPGIRLVSFVGPPGVGKTKLAIHVALSFMPLDEPTDLFPDGVAFVQLASLNHPDQVLPTILSALNLRLSPSYYSRVNGNGFPLALVSRLRAQKLLLVLDSFEHLLGAAQVVSSLLESAPHLKILVSSREPLQIYGEYRFAVKPLAYPTEADLYDMGPESLALFPAVALFGQRASATESSFQLSGDNVYDVARICAMLDGLPLAIEMAASYVNMLPLRKLRSLLVTHLNQLKYGRLERANRFGSVSEMIAWSYNLLSPEQRSVFDVMSVFADWIDVDACIAVGDFGSVMRPTPASVVADDGNLAAFDGLPALEAPSRDVGRLRSSLTALLQTLVDKGLLLREFTPQDEPRYKMLTIAREFGLEQLRMREELAPLRERHAHYFLDLAVRIGQASSPTGLPYVERMNIMSGHHADLHVALRWALFEQRDVHLAVQLAKTCSAYWISRGHWSEARHWLHSIFQQVNRPTSALAREERLALLTTISYELAFVSTQSEILDEIEAILTEQLESARAKADASGMWNAMHSLLLIYTRSGRYDKGHALHNELLMLAEQNGRPPEIAQSLAMIGISLWLSGQLDRGIEFCQRAFELSKQHHFMGGMAICLENIARATQLKGDLCQAISLFAEALNYAERAGSVYAMAYALDGIANVAGLLGFSRAFADLQGGVESISVDFGVVLEDQFRVGHEQAEVLALTTLGEADYDAAVVNGSKRSLTQALSFARRVVHEVMASQRHRQAHA